MTRLEGTVPQTQDGPPEPQNQQAQHCDPPINIHSTPDIVHTMMRNTVEKPRVGCKLVLSQRSSRGLLARAWSGTCHNKGRLACPHRRETSTK